MCFMRAGQGNAPPSAEGSLSRHPASAPVLAGVTGSLSLLVLTAYASGIISLFEVSEYAQMAMPTALAFLLVSLAIVLARPERGPMRLVSSNGAGGELARHLLPAAVGIALVVAALRLLGQMQGLYDTYVGVWMFAIVTVVLITTLMWRFASSYEHAELERKKKRGDQPPNDRNRSGRFHLDEL